MATPVRARTWWLVAVVVLFTAIAARFAQREEEGREDALESTPVEASQRHAPAVIAAEKEVSAPVEGWREAQPAATANGPGSPAHAAKPAGLRGLVVDAEGRGVPDVELLVDFGYTRTRADAHGGFDIVGEPDRIDPAPPWALVRTAREENGGWLLIVARGVTVSGRVETRGGDALDLVQIEVRVPLTALVRFTRPLDRTKEARREPVSTGADGAFELENIPAMDGTELRAKLDGYEGTTIPVPPVSASNLRIVLVPERPPEPVDPTWLKSVTGVVLLPDLSPAVGARVSLDLHGGRVDENGSFHIRVASVEDTTPLIATLRGHQAAVIPEFGRKVNRSQPEPVRLVLGDAPLSISGRVLDANGRAKVGWRVALMDGTAFEASNSPWITAEAATVEESGTDGRTGGEGEFTLRGLIARDYRLQVWSDRELVKVVTGPIMAGRNDVSIVVPAGARIPKLSGRVIGRDGQGVAGVEVRAALDVFRSGYNRWMEHSPTVKTDERGEFEITDAPVLHGHLDFGGDAIVPAAYEYAGTDTSRPIVVEVARRCHFRVESVPASSRAAHFAILDAHDEPLRISQIEYGTSTSSRHHPLTNGATPPLVVSEDAATIAFFGEKGEEVARHPIHLVPGQVTPVPW